MAIPEITMLYAGVLGLMSIYLGATCGMYRGKAGIDFGPGGDPELEMRMRRQANFLETVPLALILIALLEMQAISTYAIHGLGGAVVVGRLLHMLNFDKGVTNPLRGIGSGLSVLPIAIASIWGIVTFVT